MCERGWELVDRVVEMAIIIGSGHKREVSEREGEVVYSIGKTASQSEVGEERREAIYALIETVTENKL
jgi:hypothetical protein